jgi:hypothetical protein
VTNRQETQYDPWSPLTAIGDAITTVGGWAVIIATTFVIGFCCGYWVGHGEIMGPKATLDAMTWLPIIWLAHPTICIAYAVTALAYYVPIRFESRWLHTSAVIATLVTWVAIVAGIVRGYGSW